MPGLYTHKSFFEQCIKQSVLKKVTTEICTTNLNIYSQGHDLLMYVNPFIFSRNRKICMVIGHYYFKDFVCKYIETARKNYSFEDRNIRLFLYGYISHHILDSYIHPYIMQFCGDFLPVRNRTWVHGIIETLLDAYLIKKNEHISPQKYKIHDDFKFIKLDNTNLVKIMDMTFDEVYNFKNIGKKINMSFNSLENYVYIYRYDPNKIKRRLSSVADNVVGYDSSKFFYDEHDLYKLQAYLNSSNSIWTYSLGLDNNCPLTSTKSLWELFDDALVEVVRIIDEIESGVQNIPDIIPDKSAITGLKCGVKLDFISYNRIIKP